MARKATKVGGRAKGVSGKALKAEIQKLVQTYEFQLNKLLKPDPEWDSPTDRALAQGMMYATQNAANDLAKLIGLTIDWGHA